LNELMYCVLVGLLVAYVDASRRLPDGLAKTRIRQQPQV
jgi:hypothetical protein